MNKIWFLSIQTSLDAQDPNPNSNAEFPQFHAPNKILHYNLTNFWNLECKIFPTAFNSPGA